MLKTLNRNTVVSVVVTLVMMALMFIITLAGMQALLDLWKTVPSSEWLLPFFVIPLVAGACAVVCYLFCIMFSETDRDQKSLW